LLSRLTSALAPLRQRAGPLTAVILVHLLLLLALLSLAPAPFRKFGGARPPLIVDLLPDAAEEPEPAPAKQTSERKAERRETVPPVAPPALPPPVVPVPAEIWSKILPLSREELAAADISKMPTRDRAAGPPADASASAGGEGDGVGRAPNGEPLYNADWYRRPTNAELATYLPAGAQNGWGMVACRTVEGFRVEDCEEIGQFPPGSGLSRAVREAAWQFRVRPPRKGGRSLVGAWVRIRIEYSSSARDGSGVDPG
jgi:protein TonB